MNFFQARNKPADGSHAQKLQSGQKTPVLGQKGAPAKPPGAKPGQKPAAQKGQPKPQAPAKVAAASAAKPGKKPKKGHKHQQHDLIVTIDLVSILELLIQVYYTRGFQPFLLTTRIFRKYFVAPQGKKFKKNLMKSKF